MVGTYIDDILVITKHEFKDHLNSLEKFLQRLVEAELKVKAEKSFFGQTETKYLGFWVSNNGVRPLPSKVDSINAIDFMSKVIDILRLVGLFNY